MRIGAFTVRRIASFLAVVAFAAALCGSSAWAADPAPAISEVSPTKAARNSTQTFVVKGSGFESGATFKLEETSANRTLTASSVTVASTEEIQADVSIPANAPIGSYDAVVTNSDAQQGRTRRAVGIGLPDIFPTLDCVSYDSAREEVTATFGYVSHEKETVTASIGSNNFFSPPPSFRDQLREFAPGMHPSAFSTTFRLEEETSITWSLFNRKTTASNDESLYCEQSADVRISQSATPEMPIAGEELTYTLTATNDGPLPASGVTVTDELPGGVDLVSASADGGSCSGTERVVCSIGSLARGGSASATIVVKPERAGELVNTASIHATQNDSDASNNASTLRKAVAARATPSITSASPNEGRRGETVRIVISGSGFADGADASLVRGPIRLAVENIEAGANSISGDLSIPEGFPIGKYDVEVRNPDGQTSDLEDGFETTAPAATALTHDAGAATIKRGRTINRTGRLSAPGKEVGGRSVVLFQKTAGMGAFRPIRATETNANGGFAFRGLRPRATTSYQFRFAGSDELEASNSPVRRVVVRR